MSIIITPGKKQKAEVEFAGKHPDIFSSFYAAQLVQALAEQMHNVDHITHFRADLNMQSYTPKVKKEAEETKKIGQDKQSEQSATPIKINIAGQVRLSSEININQTAYVTAVSLLEKAGYFKTNDFSKEKIAVNTEGIIAQANVLNNISLSDKFADSCIVYGHYITEPFGLHGTFPSLILAKKIDKSLDLLIEKNTNLRPDGKVHVTIKYTDAGYVIDKVYLSIAHKKDLKNIHAAVAEFIYYNLIKEIPELAQLKKDETFQINAGGLFDSYFVQVDSGVSKAKDDVIITGGIHQLGTDRVWGKCLYKASSLLIPYAFALSKVICDVTGAVYASVSASSEHGMRDSELQLEDFDPKKEHLRIKINKTLEKIARNRYSIEDILDFKVNIHSYRAFNNINGFHNNNPWKNPSQQLYDEFRKFY